MAVVVGVGWAHRWMADDGFIYLRITEQVVAGNGPVFNAGERVEVATSPAWLAVLVVADLLLPVRLEWLAVVLGLGSAAFGLAAAMVASVRLAGGAGDRVVVPAGALVLIAPAASWAWWTSGLETGLVWAWLGGTLLLLARWSEGAEPPSAGLCVLAGLGWLVRPELVLVSALLVVALVVGEPSGAGCWRRRLRIVVVAVALPAAYQVLRMGYYGMVTANTAVAKEGSTVVWGRGVRYFGNFVGASWLWFPLVVVGLGLGVVLLGGTRRGRLAVGAFVGGGLLVGAYVVAVGGDYFHGRMFVPALFAICAPVAAVPVQRRFVGLALVVPWTVVAMAWLRPASGLASLERGFFPERFGRVTVEDFGIDRGGMEARLQRPGLHLEQNAFDPGAVRTAGFEPAASLPIPAVSASAIGLVGYVAGPEVHVIDTLGLAHPIGSHLALGPERAGLAGHEKPLPAVWFVALHAAPGERVQRRQLGVLGGGQPTLLPVLRGPAFERQVAAAREVLGCDAVDRLTAAATEPLGPGRFLRNLVSAPSNALVRIPADPAAARERLCS